MMLRVMGEVVKLRKAIDRSRHAHSAEGKVVKEGSEFSGRYSVQEVGAPAVKEWAPPTLAAISGRAGKVAVEKAISGASVHTGSASKADQVRFDQNGRAKMALPNVD